jgi:Fe-S-cluster-containing dehydrogenase component
MNRRGFLKTLGLAGAVVACPPVAKAETPVGGDPYGALVDTTRCAGCNSCTYACAEANGLPEPEDPDAVTRPTTDQWTAVRRVETSKGEVFVKNQCMHCLTPACASACLTAALAKTPDGPVVWREDKCMGCRFCMVSCPFGGPTFEYSSANPRIRKCVLCAGRVRDGEAPACVAECPEDALAFGKRAELLRIARKRIADDPGRYVDHIYGEREAGGTSWLYLAGVPFAQLGFPSDIGEETYPGLTTPFLYSVPLVLTLAPAMMLGVAKAARRGEEEAAAEADAGAAQIPEGNGEEVRS